MKFSSIAICSFLLLGCQKEQDFVPDHRTKSDDFKNSSLNPALEWPRPCYKVTNPDGTQYYKGEIALRYDHKQYGLANGNDNYEDNTDDPCSTEGLCSFNAARAKFKGMRLIWRAGYGSYSSYSSLASNTHVIITRNDTNVKVFRGDFHAESELEFCGEGAYGYGDIYQASISPSETRNGIKYPLSPGEYTVRILGLDGNLDLYGHNTVTGYFNISSN